MIVSLTNVTAEYPHFKSAVLSNVSLEVNKGGFCVVQGATGCGKSTLMKVLSGELEANSGSIQIAGFDLHPAGKRKQIPSRILSRYRQTVGFVFQDFKLLQDKTIFENIVFALEMMPRMSRHDFVNRAERTLERLELTGIRNAFPREVSHGEQAHAAIARAVVREPFVLVADEPTAQLDAASSLDILNLLRAEHRRGMTIMLLTSCNTFAIPEADWYDLVSGELRSRASATLNTSAS